MFTRGANLSPKHDIISESQKIVKYLTIRIQGKLGIMRFGGGGNAKLAPTANSVVQNLGVNRSRNLALSARSLRHRTSVHKHSQPPRSDCGP